MNGEVLRATHSIARVTTRLKQETVDESARKQLVDAGQVRHCGCIVNERVRIIGQSIERRHRRGGQVSHDDFEGLLANVTLMDSISNVSEIEVPARAIQRTENVRLAHREVFVQEANLIVSLLLEKSHKKPEGNKPQNRSSGAHQAVHRESGNWREKTPQMKANSRGRGQTLRGNFKKGQEKEVKCKTEEKGQAVKQTCSAASLDDDLIGVDEKR